MPWTKLKEMELYDKLENHLKAVPEKDSAIVEDIITDTDKLQAVKEALHEGLDSRLISEKLHVSVDQVDIIKDMLGKL
ncbi:hypothetical protein ACPWSR_09980 [Alloiococcus sp. CFN-8]|uniref:hypothetical protein n=1 Tax=Alloiococcus sp. CFN-8 TaxID=3416081 RepID=UPI003CEFB5CC